MVMHNFTVKIIVELYIYIYIYYYLYIICLQIYLNKLQEVPTISLQLVIKSDYFLQQQHKLQSSLR